ncbi:histidine kinase [Cellulomonas cellasea]|uniref:Histidine kinase n=2 Tax=Cellulomonas cellasea TaxID=43670 RepID=A0A0A0BB48_9CELL|nr:histidine kinase [Cellulomonas cellasea]KGM03114.1 hypothetical protein Q760_09455 [Cellulomonas cellasea DSM 20118]GEA87848.1 hypothetical protein CCE01nite_17970 [Cellulomonas cellasea]
MPDESHEPPPSRPDAPPSDPGVAVPATADDRLAPRQDPATPGSARASAPVPDEAELARVAEPATVRRAPKFGAFVTAGVLLGAVLGFVVALITGTAVEGDGGTGFISFLDGQGSARLLVALAGATLGALVAGLAAVVADRRSVRRR